MPLPSPEDHELIYAAWVSLGAKDWKEEDHIRLFDLLTKYGLTILNMPQIFLSVGVKAVLNPPKDVVRERLWKLFVQLGTDNLPTRTVAREKIGKALETHKFAWTGANGFTAILLFHWAHTITAPPMPGATPHPNSSVDDVPVDAFDLILALSEEHLVMPHEQHVIFALWILGCYVYDKFRRFPQLAVITPASGMGKTTLLELAKLLAPNPHFTKHVTAAGIYHWLAEQPGATFLLDEGENQAILSAPIMRAVLDGLYERDGDITRAGKVFPLFAPVALGLRGNPNDVPASLLSRSFVFGMKRGTPTKEIDENDPAFSSVRVLILKWQAAGSINLKPEMPAALNNPSNPRLRDNCRVLVGVADSFGPQQGEIARAALVRFCANLTELDSGIRMLIDIREVPFTRISTKELVAALHDNVDYWSGWRGPNDQGQPHPLTSRELINVLRRFGICARNHWPEGPREGSKSFYGYLHTDFAQAWAEHCPEDSTTPQPSKIIALTKP